MEAITLCPLTIHYGPSLDSISQGSLDIGVKVKLTGETQIVTFGSCWYEVDAPNKCWILGSIARSGLNFIQLLENEGTYEA